MEIYLEKEVKRDGIIIKVKITDQITVRDFDSIVITKEDILTLLNQNK